MVRVAIFKKNRRRDGGINRNLVRTDNGKSVKQVIINNKRAGMFSSGNFVAFRIVKNKKAFKLQGIPIAKKGVPFKN